MRSFLPSATLVAGMLLLGCMAEEQATVSGKVTLNGRPLDRGVVTFVNALGKSSPGISGQIHGDGTYVVQIGQSGQVVAGEYAAKIDARGPSVPHRAGGPPVPGELLLPVEYTQVETSGLRYRVRPGKNTIDIALATAVESPSEQSDEGDSPTQSGNPEGGSGPDGGERLPTREKPKDS